MNKCLSTLTLALLLCLASVAYGKSKPLADNQLDQISAGSAVATGESTASDTTSATVDLEGSSLSGASGVNIVNAADSTVANGANVWSGDKLNNANKVKQSNNITQKGAPCSCSPATVDSIENEDEESLDDVSANAIATDDSTATNKSTYSVTLGGSAESNAKGLNIVNAAGSIVAGGVNVASSSNMNNLSSLTQVNNITQSAH